MLTENEAYELLGLTIDADSASIKNAFRRLAMRWHPDRNPDADALEMFKRVRAAYARLTERESNETRTAEDDDPAPASPSRADDLFQDLELDLEEAFHGCERTVSIPTRTICRSCDGRGEVELAHGRLCAHCHGSGRVRSAIGLDACPACDGRGYSRRAPCPDCAASGAVPGERRLHVRVPKGIFNGEELRLSGEGERAATTNAQAGDLRLRVRIAQHPLFSLDGRDLVIERPVSAFHLLSGGPLHTPHPAGTFTVDVVAGQPTPQDIRIEGRGWPARGKRPAGAFVIRLRPLFPAESGTTLNALYRKIDAEVQRELGTYLPSLQQWEAQWLD
ncbi:J domain-containing protein [Azoarcus sp. L1K30]|uniref:DnaJ C-terminal domain-containing protein n=1 Tax=Azoarcus sp. L1K30 TaxID=2820277 RepID=UPI001B8373F3|nr:J domain-containing protein [Azoarcus sp. L1K30]MBR0565693.1 J domain-containing protein [Azoarcus sp. L1K30]